MDNHQEDERNLEKLEAAIYRTAGPKSMKRDRPYDGQPWTTHGKRGGLVVEGLTKRDLYDCMVRGYILSHSSYVEGTLTDLEPNATLIREAKKGPFAQLNGNNMFELVGGADPVAVMQNTMCEIEKLMGVFPYSDRKKPNERIPVILTGPASYIAESGLTIERENEVIVDGNVVAKSVWVMRGNMKIVDYDWNLQDLLERHNLELIY